MPTTVFSDNSLCFYGTNGDGRYATVSGVQLSPGSSHSSNSWDSRSSVNSTAMSPDTTTCEDGTNRPFLKIIEQPTSKFRFRYRSEMQGTHGAIQGERATKQKKTFPTVKLCNYDNVAYIRCTLYSADENNRHIHAHRLVAKSPDRKEDKDDPHDMKVGPVNSYEACFQTMVIIHTPRKLIIDELVKKKKLQITSRRLFDTNVPIPDVSLRKMMNEAQRESEVMDMNKVSLRFDALKEDPLTGELVEICKPVYSVPIQNMKSHLTSDLKICRIDKHIGSCRGGEEVFIFVEKVSKKNIKVRFFELNEDEEESWCDYARFSETDVHHQYAIAFRTPPYKDLKIDQYVPVYIQLERPSDKCVSEKIDFQYKPEYQITNGNKRKAVEDIRLVLPSQQLSPPQLPDSTDIPVLEDVTNFDCLSSLSVSGLLGDLSDELMPEIHQTMESIPSLTKELEKIPSANSQEFKRFMDCISTEDLEAYVRSLSDDETEVEHIRDIVMDISQDDSNVVPDGVARHKGRTVYTELSDDVVIDGASAKKEPQPVNKGKETLSADEMPVFTQSQWIPFSKENLPHVVIDLVKTMKRVDKHMVNSEMLHRLELLFSNEVDRIDRDSVLHMAVMYGKEKELEILLDVLKTYNKLSCVDSKNKEQKTPLHVAAQLKLEKLVELLLSYKADPAIQDTFGNTALHYATTEQSIGIVKRLVSAMQIPEIDARNEDGQTALHIAVWKKLYDIVEVLLKAGADVNRRNACTGDTLLHIAVNNRDVKMVNILVKEERLNMTVKNYSSNCTPLEHLLDSTDMEAKQEICNILLEYESNPKKRMVFDLVKSYTDVKKEGPDMVEVDGQLVDISKKIKQEFFSNEELNIMDVDIRNSPPSSSNNLLTQAAAAAVFVDEDEIKKEKSESDDEMKYSKQNEYLDGTSLDKLTLDDEQNYDDLGNLGVFDNKALSELCPLLDGNGGWKLLAIRLGFRDFLQNFSKHWSPTFLLLLYVDKYYSKTLRDIKDHLVEINQKEAASALERLIKRNED